MKHTVWLVAVALILAACNKEKNNAQEQEIRNCLTAHSWQLLSGKRNGTAEAVSFCQLDDVFTYASNGVKRWTPGRVPCSENELLAYEGTWQLAGDQLTERNKEQLSRSTVTACSHHSLVLTTTTQSGDVLELTYQPAD